MADNSDRTPGSGEKVATDELTYSGDTAKIQLIRVVHVEGTEGSKTLTEISTTQGLGIVNRRDLQAIRVQSGGLTIATTAYSAGDQVGSQFTFANAARASGGTGTIVGVTMVSAQDAIGAYDLVLTDSSITLASDNAAYAISDSDARNVIGIVQLAGSYDIGNNRICQAFNIAMPYICEGGTSLYGGLITRAGHTFFAAVTDIELTLWVERN